MSTDGQSEQLLRFWAPFVHDPLKFVATFWPHFTLAPYQQEILRSVATNTETWVHSANEMGKCLGRDTAVMMFDGSVKMCQDVRVGDLLMGDDSTPRRVLSTTKGYGPLFVVRPKAQWHDKRRRVAPYLNEYVCNADHILSLQWSTAKKDFATKDISVSDWLSGNNEQRARLSGYRAPVEFEEKPVRIDPYFLGVWLGDGHRHIPAITTPDKEIVDVVRREAESRGLRMTVQTKEGNKASSYFLRRCTAKDRNSMTDDLRSYGLLCKVTQPSLKHVPDEYKINSRRVRSEILAGLIDTDGESYPTGYRFSNKSHRLACDVVWLARSLGLGADISECTKRSQNGTEGIYYRVMIRGNGLPCRIHRKRPHHDSINAPHRYGIIRIDPIGDGEYFGFCVDGNRRFLLGDFTVTHNSFTAALTAIWWFSTRPSKVVTMSTTQDQLEGVLWGEIGDLLSAATHNGRPFDFGFVTNHLEIRYKSEEHVAKPKYYLRGRVAAKVESIQGNHLPTMYDPETGRETGTVLFVVEEGSGVDDVFFPAISTQAHSTLIIGNPIRDQGVFAETCKAGRRKHPNLPGKLIKNVIHVSGEDSPNVKIGRLWKKAGRPGEPPRVGPNGECWHIPGILSYDTFIEREETLHPHEKRTRLYGKFPEEEGQRMFPSSWLEVMQLLGKMLRQRAAERSRRGKFAMPGRPFGLGIDVAQGGGDLSVWVVWGRFGVADVVAKDTPNTAEIAGTTLAMMRKYHIGPAWVAFDAGGGGKQIADGLRENGYEEILDVDFGAAADDPRKYKNKRAELYGELREAMTVNFNDDKKPNGMIGRMLAMGPGKWGSSKLHCASLPPDDSLLRQDLAVLPLLRDQEGRLRMLPKDKPKRQASGRGEKCLRELLGRSPDRGDACALARYAWSRGKEYAAAEEYDGDLVY